MSKRKPGIIVTVPDDSDVFKWWSDGWYEVKKRHTPEAQALWDRAHAAIEAAEDVPQAIRLLKAAGFEVTRDLDPDRDAKEMMKEGA